MSVTVLFVLITVATIVANAGAAAADLTQADFALANPVRVGVPGTWLPALGTLKIAGAAGLLLGLLGVRDIGITAAAGLVRFLLGATGVQLRAREHRHIVTTAATSCWPQRRWRLPSHPEGQGRRSTSASCPRSSPDTGYRSALGHGDGRSSSLSSASGSAGKHTGLLLFMMLSRRDLDNRDLIVPIPTRSQSRPGPAQANRRSPCPEPGKPASHVTV
jgi:hypothetical protein